MKKQHKEDYPLEYEEYGNLGMYLFAVFALSILIGVSLLIAAVVLLIKVLL